MCLHVHVNMCRVVDMYLCLRGMCVYTYVCVHVCIVIMKLWYFIFPLLTAAEDLWPGVPAFSFKCLSFLSHPGVHSRSHFVIAEVLLLHQKNSSFTCRSALDRVIFTLTFKGGCLCDSSTEGSLLLIASSYRSLLHKSFYLFCLSFRHKLTFKHLPFPWRDVLIKSKLILET